VRGDLRGWETQGTATCCRAIVSARNQAQCESELWRCWAWRSQLISSRSAFSDWWPPVHWQYYMSLIRKKILSSRGWCIHRQRFWYNIV